MNYLAFIRKPSPIHSLWRKQNLHKANLQGTLFTFNKRLQRYEAAGPTGENLEALVRNPHVHLALTTEAINEVVVASTSDDASGDPTPDLETEAPQEVVSPTESEGSAPVQE